MRPGRGSEREGPARVVCAPPGRLKHQGFVGRLEFVKLCAQAGRNAPTETTRAHVVALGVRGGGRSRKASREKR
jgi:hypothetical protein